MARRPQGDSLGSLTILAPRLRGKSSVRSKTGTRKPKRSGVEGPSGFRDYFEIRLSVKNAPPDTVSVVYQLDKSFPKRFTEVKSKDGVDYPDTITTFGDNEIRATVWTARGGEGLCTRLLEALRRTYGKVNKGSIAEAMRKLDKNSK